MRRALALAAVLTWLASPVAAAAATRIAVGPIRNDPKVAIPAQLATGLCRTFDCVLWPAVSSRREIDLAKVKANRVAGVLVGAISRGPRGAQLSLSLVTTSTTTPARTWSFPLTAAGLLSASALRQLAQELDAALQPVAARPAAAAGEGPGPGSGGAATGGRPARPRADPAPEGGRARGRLAAAGSPRGPAPAAGSARRPAGRAPVAGAMAPGGGAGWVPDPAQAELRRRLGPPPARCSPSTPRRSWGLPCTSTSSRPRAPDAAPSSRGWGSSPTTRPPWGSRPRRRPARSAPPPSRTCRWAARWRSPRLGGFAVLVPSLSYQAVRLKVSTPIDGLPDASLTGLKAGLGAEAVVGAGGSRCWRGSAG